MEANFCGKCGSALNAQGVCTVCTAERETEQEALVQPTPKKKNKKKLIIIIVALVLVVALALTTIFVVLPMFNKKEDNKFYSSGKDGVAFKTDPDNVLYKSGVGVFKTNSDVVLFDTDLGLVNVRSDSEITVHPFGREENTWIDNGDYVTNILKKSDSVCVGNDIYLMDDEIYKVQILKDGSYKKDVWLSAEEIEALDISYGGYDVSDRFFLVGGSNLQYYDGYIYYSKTMPITEEPMSSELVNVIGRINIKDKSVEILKIVENYSYNFDYVV